MLEGKYWALFGGGELLGVTTDQNAIPKALWAAYTEDTKEQQPRAVCYDLKLKFGTYTLLVNGVPISTYYAMNTMEITA